MEVVEFSLNYARPDVFHFYPFSDIHAGSIDCVEDDVKARIKECAERKNAYAFGLGDYADCITRNDPRFDMDGLASWVTKTNIAESQRKWVVDLFKPLADKKKLICLGTGNHEEEIHMRHDNDIVRNICSDLNVPYAGFAYFLVLTFIGAGKPPSTRQYILHCWHGAGAAQSEGGRIMRLMRLVNDIEANIYLMAHLHTIAVYTPDRLSCRRGRIKSHPLIAATTGSWLKTYTQPKEGQKLNASYGEKKGYKPSRLGNPILHIQPDKDKYWIEL